MKLRTYNEFEKRYFPKRVEERRRECLTEKERIKEDVKKSLDRMVK